jgi:hypothetical protein
MTMQIKEIPRDALELGFRGARLPLTVAEKLLARGDSGWPPALVFDKVEAEVKDIVGRATRDETLQASARLQRANVTKREEAMAERAHAAEVGQQAEARAEARRDEQAAKREAVEDAEAQREQQIEQAEREARERAAKEAEAKRSATRTTAAKRKQAASKRATRADAERLENESQALHAKQAAVEARAETLDLDKAVQAKKSARRSR